MFRRFAARTVIPVIASGVLASTAYCSAPKITHEEDEQVAAKYRPNLEEFERVDENIFDSKYDKYRSQHIIYSALLGESKVERYEIYKSKKTQEIYCLLKLGDKVNGWPNIVHGGLSALLIDNTYGWLFTAFQLPAAVTANLTVNYR